MYIRYVVFLLLVLLCHSQRPTLSLSYSFPYNSTGLTNPYYASAFNFGTLSVNYSLSATFTVPKLTSASFLTTFIGLLNAGTILALRYIDNTGASPVLRQAYTASGSPISYSTSNIYNNIYRMTYDVGFPSSYTLSSAEFIFIMNYNNPSFHYYTFDIDYFPTSMKQSVGNAATFTKLIRLVDVVRSEVYKIIYVSQAN